MIACATCTTITDESGPATAMAARAAGAKSSPPAIASTILDTFAGEPAGRPCAISTGQSRAHSSSWLTLCWVIDCQSVRPRDPKTTRSAWKSLAERAIAAATCLLSARSISRSAITPAFRSRSTVTSTSFSASWRISTSHTPRRWCTSRFQTCATLTFAVGDLAIAIVTSTADCDASLPSVASRILSKRFGVLMGTSFPSSPAGAIGSKGPVPRGLRPARRGTVELHGNRCAGVWRKFASMSRAPDRKDVLLEAGLALASELSLPIVLQRIVDLAAQVTDARYGALGVIGEGGELVEFITTGISARQRRAIGPLPRGRGILGLLIKQPRAIRITDIASHPEAVGFPANHPPMKSFLGAPVQAM